MQCPALFLFDHRSLLVFRLHSSLFSLLYRVEDDLSRGLLKRTSSNKQKQTLRKDLLCLNRAFMQKTYRRCQHKDEQHDRRQTVRSDSPASILHLQAGASIGFCFIVLPAPAITGHAEQIDQRAQGQQQVLTRKSSTSMIRCRQRLQSHPHFQTLKPSTGHGQHYDQYKIDQSRLLRFQLNSSMQQQIRFSNTASTVDRAANSINRKNKLPPEAPACHIGKDIGQGDEDQAGASPSGPPHR